MPMVRRGVMDGKPARTYEGRTGVSSAAGGHAGGVNALGRLSIFRIIWARRVIVLLTLVNSAVGAALATLMLPVQYEATSPVLLEMIETDPVTGTVVNGGFADVYVRSQLELVFGDEVMDAVTDALGWTTAPELMTAYAQAVPSGSPDYRTWLRQILKGSLHPQMRGESAVLDIAFVSNNPEAARAIADSVRAAYVSEAITDRRRRAEETAAFLDRQALEFANQLAAADRRAAVFEQRTGVMLTDFGDIASGRLSALSAARDGPAPKIPTSRIDPAPQVTQLDAAIATQAATLGDNHPAIQALRRQRDALSRVADDFTAANGSRFGRPSVAAQFSAAQAAVLANAPVVAEARRLQAEVAQLRARYVNAAVGAANLRRQAQAETANLRPLESATTPTEKIFPNTAFIVGSSIVLGLVTGVLLALIAEGLSRRVRASGDLALGDVPVFPVAAEPTARRGLWRRLTDRFRQRRAAPAGAELVPA